MLRLFLFFFTLALAMPFSVYAQCTANITHNGVPATILNFCDDNGAQILDANHISLSGAAVFTWRDIGTNTVVGNAATYAAFIPSSTTQYEVEINDAGNTCRDTVNVTFHPSLNAGINFSGASPDSIRRCVGDGSFTLTANTVGHPAGTSYAWLLGGTTLSSTTSANITPVAGLNDYILRVRSPQNCDSYDTLKVQMDDVAFALPADTTLCTGTTFSHRIDSTLYDAVVWQDGSTGFWFTSTIVDGTVWAEVTRNGCTRRDTMLVARISCACDQSTTGTEFWLSFMEFHSPTNKQFSVTATSDVATNGRIFIGGAATPAFTFAVPAGGSSTTNLTVATVEPMGSEVIENKGIRIETDDPVNLYALAYHQFSSDATLVYPTSTLDDDYYVVCYTPNSTQTGNQRRNSELVVAATQDNTVVTITPSVVTAGLRPAGVPFNVTLNAGEVYQVQSANMTGTFNAPPTVPAGQGDLTGSRVQSDKPVAVFGGNYRTIIPNIATCCWDNLYQQIPPNSSLGTEYITIPFLTRSWDIFRIVAPEDNTQVTIDGAPIPIMNAGDFYEFDTQGNNNPRLIQSDKAVSVTQYSTSGQNDLPNPAPADPFMITLSPTVQMIDDITFEAFNSTVISSYYLNVLTKTANVPNVILDGNPAGGNFSPVVGTQYSFAQIPITQGTHNINSGGANFGFLAYIYGYGNAESYGYSAGTNLQTVLDIGPPGKGGDTTLCVGSSLLLQADIFPFYEWSTGETTQDITVTESGVYWVRGVDDIGCEKIDSVNVIFYEPENEILHLGVPEDTIRYCDNDGPQWLVGTHPTHIRNNTDTLNVTYNWTDLAGASLGTNDSLEVASFSDTVTYVLEVTDTTFMSLNCQSWDTITVIFFPTPQIQVNNNFLSDTVRYCNQESPQIISAGFNPNNFQIQYTWTDLSNGNVLSNTQNLTVSGFSDTSAYEVEIFDPNLALPCGTKDTVYVVFNPHPDFEIRHHEGDSVASGFNQVSTLTFCISDGTQTLNGYHPSHGVGNMQYEWFKDSDYNNPLSFDSLLTISPPVTLPPVPELYTLRVSDTSDVTNCPTVDSLFVLYYENPVPDILYNGVSTDSLDFCDDEGAQTLEASHLSHGPGVQVLWYELGGAYLGSGANLTVGNFSASTTYEVVFTDTTLYNRCASRDTVTVNFFYSPQNDRLVEISDSVFCETGTPIITIQNPEVGMEYVLVDENGNTVDSQLAAGGALQLFPGTLTALDPNATTTYEFEIQTINPNSPQPCQVVQQSRPRVRVSPAPAFTITEDATICAGDQAPVRFNLTGVFPMDLTYQVEFSDGTTQTETVTGITSSPLVVQADSGRFSVLSISDANCTPVVTNSPVVEISATPIPDVSLITYDRDTTICANDTISFEASGADEYIFHVNNVAVQASNSPVYSPGVGVLTDGDMITVQGITNGCDDWGDTIYVNIAPVPYVNLGIDREICRSDSGGTTIFVADQGGNPMDWVYDWRRMDDPNTPIGIGHPSLTVSDTGSYFIILTDLRYPTRCSFTSDTIQVTYKDSPVLDLGPDTILCDTSHLPHPLIARDLVHDDKIFYEWYKLEDTTRIYLGDSAVYMASEGGYYQAVVTDTLTGCQSFDTIRVRLTPDPDFIIKGHDEPVCQNEDTLYVEATNLDSMLVEWFDPAGQPMGNELVQLVDNSGVYTVIVTDTSTYARCSLTKSIEVKLYGDPISPFVDFADTTVCEGDSLYFNADHFTHDIGTTYRWTSLWDDAVLSDSATLSLGFDQLTPQTYDTLALEILITNPGGCTTADTLLFKFDRPPSLTLTASDSAICLGESITLFAEGGDSILWSTGETGNQITIAPEQAGDTTIIVTSMNPNRCASVSDTITLYIGGIPDLEIGEDTVLCETDSITYDAFDFRQPFYTQYAWLLDGDTSNVLSTNPQLTVVDSMAPRGYEPFRLVAVVTDSLTGCWNSDTVTVQFQRPPTIEIQPYDSMICAGETIVLNTEGTDSVRWYFQDTTAMGKQLLDSPTVEGYYQYIAEGWFPNACSSVFDTAWVYVNPLPEIRAHVVDTVNICADDSVTLLPSGGVSYTWAHDPNATDTLRFVPLQDTSTYVVTGIDANGCSNTDTVVVITTPTIDLGDDIQLCVGDTAFIGQRSPVPATYFWWPTGDTSATLSVTQPGTYEVAVTVDSCTYTRSVDVEFKAIPQLVLLQDTTLCFEYGEEMDYATGFPHTIGYALANRDSLATYLEVWTDSDSTYLGNGDSIQITAPGTYRIRVMAQYDKVACEATDTTRVEELCAPRIFIPDAFSPNGDDLNDRFQVFGRHVVDFQMQVYDRWGTLIYNLEKERIEDILEDEWWDGTINGTSAQDGSYQYVIRYRGTMDYDPGMQVKRGSLLILR